LVVVTAQGGQIVSLTRRRFAKSASLSLLASAAFPHAFAQSRSKGVAKEDEDPFRPENLVAFNGISMQTFAPLVGEEFTVSSDIHSLGSMTLMAVTNLSSTRNASVNLNASKSNAVGRAPRPSWQIPSAFSVHFQGAAAALPQGTYTIYNAGLGSMPLLLVPSGPGVSPPTCTAIFNFLETQRQS
jgi:hypothetical protein